MSENPEFLTEQLITYIGNKRSLLDFIKDAVDFVKEKYHNDVIFFVGSFYIYGTVIRRLKKCEMI